MADISNKSLGLFVGLALMVSAVGFLSLNGSLVSYLTGLATSDYGEVKINITESASLNLTQRVIDFGNGSVTESYPNCTMTSEIAGDPNTCFTAAWGSEGAGHGGFRVVNIGNVNLNVTVTSIKTAATFWGVTGGEYLFKCTGNNSIAQPNYTALVASAQPCVRNLSVSDGSDAVTVEINITIPITATGYKNDTITITGSKA